MAGVTIFVCGASYDVGMVLILLYSPVVVFDEDLILLNVGF